MDNIEVVGLLTPSENEDDEDLLLECINSINLDREPIVKDDIDICHQIPTRRRDHKRVVMCKFMSGKSKIAVLSAKKGHRNLQYRGSPIFINDHLSPNNRRLFTAASQIKRDFKFLWTKNDASEVIEISDDEVISQLRDIVNNNIHSSARPEE